MLGIHRSAEGIIGMREVTISCSILGYAVIIFQFSTKLGNSSQSSVNIPGAPPEVTQRLVILTDDSYYEGSGQLCDNFCRHNTS